MTEETERKWISGFWRRIGALLIDTLILGAVGLLLGLLLERFFVPLGGWGRLVGFSIALIYFGIMNSDIMNGQTIGKKILNIRVVDNHNRTISLGKSLLRYIILGLPFSLNGAHFSNEVIHSFLIHPISLIIFGGFLSILYLYIFNRVTRQSLHDIVVGSYVVNVGAEQQETTKVANIHIIAVVILFIAAALAPSFTSQFANNAPFKEISEIQSILSNESNVTHATVSFGTSTFSSNGEEAKTTAYISSQVFLKADNVNDIELARRFASIITTHYPDALKRNAIQITLTYGYDIGIASRWSNSSHVFNPHEIQSAE